MSHYLHPFPQLLHPPSAAATDQLPVTRNGVRHVATKTLRRTQGPLFTELRINEKTTGATSRGLCGLLPATAFLDGTVRFHEKTLTARLLRQEEAIRADHGALGKPVLLTVPSLSDFWARLDADHARGGELATFFGTNNDYRLRAYRADRNHPTQALPLPAAAPLVIADGHHRAETHARLAAAGVDGCALVPVCLIGADQLTIGTFTRTISDPRSVVDVLTGLSHFFDCDLVGQPEAPLRPGQWLLATTDGYYQLTRNERTDSLDSAWLDQTVLPAVFGIQDTRSDDRISFDFAPPIVNGLIDLPATPGSVTFCGFPLPMADFFQEVVAGRCLPPKSTKFEPRVPSGLIVWQPGFEQVSR